MDSYTPYDLSRPPDDSSLIEKSVISLRQVVKPLDDKVGNITIEIRSEYT